MAPSRDEEQDAVPLIGTAFSQVPEQEEEPVFQLIQRVRKEVRAIIDSALSYDQLKSTQINYSIVTPLLLKLSALGGGGGHDKPPPALLFALLVNRTEFLELSSQDLAFAGLNASRAAMCELLATRVLSAYDDNSLLAIVAAPFNPFSGAEHAMFQEGEIVEPEELAELKRKGEGMASNALELGIYSGAKRFVQSPLIQNIIESIYNGNVIYQSPDRIHSFMSDDYKKNPVVQVFDWRNSPFLDHYRLRVPKIRSALDLFTFFMLVSLFLTTQSTRDDLEFTLVEGIFVVWSLGFALDEFGSLNENGISMYLRGEHNLLDSIYCLIFFAYLALRMSALAIQDTERSEFAFDTLSLAAIILFPRLSISLVRNNVVLLALAAMIKEFVIFMGLAALTASGFLCAFYVLSRGSWDLGRIAWLLFKMWLGGSSLGFDSAQEFHPVYGPFLVVLYALLSQTLLLTILISLLSNTFAAIQTNAQSEILHQRALRTLERVKSDALAAYMPPMNLIAFAILLPLRFVVSPRWFHKTNITLTRIFNLPILVYLAISVRLHHHSTSRPKLGSSSSNFDTPLRAAALIRNETGKFWNSLPPGIRWDGPLNSVGRVFERKVNERGWTIRNLGEADSAEGEGEGEEEDDVMVTPPKSKGKEKRASLVPSIREPVLSRGKPSHSRIGSLSSPLARLFGARAIPTDDQSSILGGGGGGGNHDSNNLVASTSFPFLGDIAAGGTKGKKQDDEDTKILLERLDKLEEMLAVLVRGELARSSAEEALVRPPLRSLTGENEE